MTPDFSLEAEQAVLGALLADAEALNEIADLFRPELFHVPANREIAVEILALAAEQQPVDPVLVHHRLEARKAGVPAEIPLSLARSVGITANVRHYVEALESLWAKRETRRICAEAARSDRDVGGEEFVAWVAERLSAIETKRGRPAQKLASLMFQRLERLEDYQKHPEKLQVWRTGYAALDAMVGGFRPGHLFTLAARPGVGKSAFVVGIVENLALRGIPVGILQLEDYADSIADRSLMRLARIPSQLMRDGARWDQNLWGRASATLETVSDWPIFVDDQHGRTIHEITGAMRRMAREHGVKVFVLDNLAEVVIDRQDRSDERLDRALGRIAKQYRDTAAALGAAPLLVVHLNRDVDKRGDGRPRMSDLKNSGELEDASHVVAMLSRPPESDVLTVDLAKNRNGPPGQTDLHFDRDLMAVREREA